VRAGADDSAVLLAIVALPAIRKQREEAFVE
jgi:hypothetical protein